MLISASLALVLALVLFASTASLIAYETRQGRRVVLSHFRDWLDRVVAYCSFKIRSFLQYLGRHVIQLTWYYSLHSFLRAVLKIIVSVYDYFEALFHKNRARAKAIRAERRVKTTGTMLQSVAEHKQNIALTPAQKKKLRTKKLERE